MTENKSVPQKKENGNKQYLKYKERFKQYGIVDLLAKGTLLFSAIFFLFLPCFKIIESEEILGQELELFSVKFSVFDEIVLIFKNLFGEGTIGSDDEGFGMMLSVFQIFGIGLMIFSAAFLLKDFIKNILNFVNLENFALEEYDKLKTGSGQNSAKAFRKVNSEMMFYMGIIMESFLIAAMKMFAKMPRSGFEDSMASYMIYANAVTSGFYVVLLFLIVSVGLSIYKSRMLHGIKINILKEDYEVETEEEEENSEQEAI